MATYSKICIVCQKEYPAKKINALYCSDECKNKARYIPKITKLKLIERNSRFTIHVVDKDYLQTMQVERFSGYSPEKSSNDNPLGKDEGLLIAAARAVAESRGLKVPSGNTLEELTKNKPVDNEMLSMKLPDIPTEDKE